MLDQIIVGTILFITLVLFIIGRWRFDIVALFTLLILTLLGQIPFRNAFEGFGHPAVITVAAVLVVSKGLENSGLVDWIAHYLRKLHAAPIMQIATLTVLITVLSAFMNNIGALAILMPVAIVMARENKYPPSLILMPIAFGSLLGGMTTLIGTPPNIIIASIRTDVVGEPFQMFDFTPVGIGVAIFGVAFVSLIGWRLIPSRKGMISAEELFDVENYLTELIVPKKSPLIGQTLKELENSINKDFHILGIVRKKQKIHNPSVYETLHSQDIIIVQTDSEGIQALTDSEDLELLADRELGKELLKSDEIYLMEAVVSPRSIVRRKTASKLQLRKRFGVQLLAVAREGKRIRKRLHEISLQPGDVLLLRGIDAHVQEAITTLGCLPLAERGLRVAAPTNIAVSIGIFSIAIGFAAVGWIPVQIAFSLAAIGMYLTGILKAREIYEQIDWPIIVLLGAMIPVGKALETTGGARTIAESLLWFGADTSPILLLTLVLVVTMFLSDLVNNAAAAVMMAPIAIQIARAIGASVDPFLMSVAIGASCAFLTPIGHQSNALVMGPAGYQFGDYWRMGLPLEVLIVVVGIPLLVYFWPLYV